MRRVSALAVALAVGFASVTDSAATCHDEGGAPGGAEAPSAPAPPCAGMPCQTPGEAAGCALAAPALVARPSPAIEPGEPGSAEAPPPPTPPPNAGR